MKFGRFTGQKAPYSSLIISGEIDEILDYVKINFLSLMENENIDAYLTITVQWHTQCNFEWDHKQLKKIADLKISCGISCYSEEE